MSSGALRTLIKAGGRNKTDINSPDYLISRATRRAFRDGLGLDVSVGVSFGRGTLDEMCSGISKDDLIGMFCLEQHDEAPDGCVALTRRLRAFALGGMRRAGCGIPDSPAELEREPTRLDFVVVGVTIRRILAEIESELAPDDPNWQVLAGRSLGRPIGPIDVARDEMQSGRYKWLTIDVSFADGSPAERLTLGFLNVHGHGDADFTLKSEAPDARHQGVDVTMKMAVQLRAAVTLRDMEKVSVGQVIRLKQPSSCPVVEIQTGPKGPMLNGVLGAEGYDRAVQLGDVGRQDQLPDRFLKSE